MSGGGPGDACSLSPAWAQTSRRPQLALFQGRAEPWEQTQIRRIWCLFFVPLLLRWKVRKKGITAALIPLRERPGRVRSWLFFPARPHVGRAGPWAPRPSGSERSSSRPSCSPCTVTPTSFLLLPRVSFPLFPSAHKESSRNASTLHRLRHRDLYGRRGVRAGHLQSCCLDGELVLDHCLPTLRRHARLLEDRGLQC